jgi:hypothetical protein
VEDIVDVRPLRKVKAFGDVAHAHSHLERASVLGPEFTTRPGNQGMCLLVKEPEPNPFAEFKA